MGTDKLSLLTVAGAGAGLYCLVNYARYGRLTPPALGDGTADMAWDKTKQCYVGIAGTCVADASGQPLPLP